MNEPDATAVNHLISANHEEIAHYLKQVRGDRRKVVLALAPTNSVLSVDATQEPTRSVMRQLFEAANGGPLVAMFPTPTIVGLLAAFDADGQIAKRLKANLRADQGRLVVIVGQTIAIQNMAHSEVANQVQMKVARAEQPSNGADAVELPNGDYALSAVGTLKLVYNVSEGEVGRPWAWVKIAAFQRYVRERAKAESLRSQRIVSAEDVLEGMAGPLRTAMAQGGEAASAALEAILDRCLTDPANA